MITDSSSDVSIEFIKEHNINVLPFRIIYKDREYKDKIEISARQVYEGFAKEIPTSSLPSMQDMEEMYIKLENEGYTHAVVITISTGLSGIYNALKLVSENHPKIKTFLYDSKSISLGTGLLVEECAKMIEEGKSFDEITKAVDDLHKRMHLFFIVGTLEYLKRGGRIGRISGTLGEMLNIKPIASVGEDGKYYVVDKVRGRKQSLKRMAKLAMELLQKKRCSLYMVDGYAREETLGLFNEIKTYPNIVKAEFRGDLSPVAGVHSGPGLVGVILIEEP